MFEGRPPPSVNLHFRRFKISTIPLGNDKAFEVWLRNRWREKDYLLEHFVRFNRFPEDDKWMITQRDKANPAKFIETQIKSNSVDEFLSIFAPLSSFLMLLSVAYGGTNPTDLMQMLTANDKNAPGQLKLLQSGLTTDNLRKLQYQIPSSTGPSTALGLSEAAQKDFILKYLISIKPAVSKHIALQGHQLQSNPTSSASASVQALSSRGSFRGPKSITRASKPPLRPRPTPGAVSQEPVRKDASGRPLKSNSKGTSEKSDNTPRRQSVTIDPKMLARMNVKNARQGNSVSVRPSITAKTRADEKVK
jgi:hypothetical protein